MVGEMKYNFPLILTTIEDNLLLKAINVNSIENVYQDELLRNILHQSLVEYIDNNDDERKFSLEIKNMDVFCVNENRKYPDGAVVLNCSLKYDTQGYDIKKVENYYKYLAQLTSDYNYSITSRNFIKDNNLHEDFQNIFSHNINHHLREAQYRIEELTQLKRETVELVSKQSLKY